MKNNIQKRDLLKAKVQELNLSIKAEKENAKLAKANAKNAKDELVSEFEKEFKNPFKLYNFYSKNIELIRVRELNPNLPLLSKDEFFELFDKAKETKKLARIESLENKRQDALVNEDLAKVNSIDKALLRLKAKPVSEFALPFTLNTLLSLVR